MKMLRRNFRVLILFVFSVNYGNGLVLTPTRNTSDAFNFIVMADWGGLPFFPYYSPFEKATASGMASIASHYNSHAVFALGDNFYFDGVLDEHDPRFSETFEKIFYQESLMNIDWYLVAGNHDHNGNVTGQIEYTKHSKRWKFPRMWYQVSIVRPTYTVSIVMIDTVILCGNSGHDKDHFQPTGPENSFMADDQLIYIESALKNASKSDYILVMGHFPVYSVAEHGPTQCLLDKLNPLLVKYKVSAYFCGHDHNLQHIQDPATKINYFVSGAVDVVDPSMKNADKIPDGSLLYHWANILGLGGFATVDVDHNGMTVKFHSAYGGPENLLYKYMISPRK